MAAHAAAQTHTPGSGLLERAETPLVVALVPPHGNAVPKETFGHVAFPMLCLWSLQGSTGRRCQCREAVLRCATPCCDELCQTAPCRAALCPPRTPRKPLSGWAPRAGSHPLPTSGYGVPPSFTPQPHLRLRGQSGVPAASTRCACSPRAPCVAHAVPGRAESPVPPPAPPRALLRHPVPPLGGGSPNRWQEEALGHHQLLLSLADDTECKFCWHYSLRLFCLCIPPVLITVIEL